MNPLAINMIRTYVPVLVGAVASYLVAHGVHVQPDQAAWAVASMTGVFTAAYYTIVRVLEERWPWIGTMLLLSKPAASLHVAGACTAQQEEDYGEDWPPADDGHAQGWQQTPAPITSTGTTGHMAVAAPSDGSADYHYASGPSGSQVVYDQEADRLGPAHPAYQPPAEMLRVRKADTGAIPVYQRPPGR